MKYLKRFLMVVITIVLFSPILFLILLVVFEDKPPNHEADWSQTVNIKLDDMKDIYQQVMDYSQQIDSNITGLVFANYRIDKNYDYFSQTYYFYVPPKDELPNGMLEIDVDFDFGLLPTITSAHMRYDEDKITDNRVNIAVLNDINDCLEEKLRILEYKWISWQLSKYWVKIGDDSVSVEVAGYVESDKMEEYLWKETFDISEFLELTSESFEFSKNNFISVDSINGVD